MFVHETISVLLVCYIASVRAIKLSWHAMHSIIIMVVLILYFELPALVHDVTGWPMTS